MNGISISILNSIIIIHQQQNIALKKLFSLPVLILISLFSVAQTASVSWGEEFKLRKGSTDLSVIHADKTGVYVKESHLALKGYFVIAVTTRESASLIKLDNSLGEVYRNDFNKELKGKEYEEFFFLKDKLFILATDYSRKDKTLTLFAAQVDKSSGELSGEWQEVTNWQKDDKSDDIDFKTTYNYDSSKLVLVSSLKSKEKNTYEVRQFDINMKAAGKPVVITNEFERRKFQLEDVQYISNGNVVMVARVYDYEEGKKQKAKFLQFQNYNIRIYNGQGSLVKEVNTDISAKWLMSTKVIQVPNKDLVLAAFYSDAKKGKEINGMLLQRIDPVTGNVISTSLKDINTTMITTLEDDNGDDDGDDESKKERKEREKLDKIQNDQDGFSKYMRFRNFIYTADSGLVILAEKYHHYQYTTVNSRSTGVGFGNSMTTTTTTYQVYECGDMMMAKVNIRGEINWLHIVPKEQREVIQTGSSSSSGTGISFGMGTNFFDNAFNMPFYAGFGTLASKNSISIIFNDHRKNDKVLQLGQKVKRISYFRKSECFGISLDPITGKYTRNSLFSNNDQPTAMPRLGSNLGKDMYIVGKEDRLLGKTKIAVARISLKN